MDNKESPSNSELAFGLATFAAIVIIIAFFPY